MEQEDKNVNYKELIECLICPREEEYCKDVGCYGFDCKKCDKLMKKEAASAIETLLKDLQAAAAAIGTLLIEREAAMEYVPHNCQTCKWWQAESPGMFLCKAPDGFETCYLGKGNVWEWRGAEQAPDFCCASERYCLNPDHEKG